MVSVAHWRASSSSVWVAAISSMAMTINVNKLASNATSTSSITSWLINGPINANTSSASAKQKIRANAAFSPWVLPISSRRRIFFCRSLTTN
ncbi:hypothetical protein D3C71_1348410 [compost metagenome]